MKSWVIVGQVHALFKLYQMEPASLSWYSIGLFLCNVSMIGWIVLWIGQLNQFVGRTSSNSLPSIELHVLEVTSWWEHSINYWWSRLMFYLHFYEIVGPNLPWFSHLLAHDLEHEGQHLQVECIFGCGHIVMGPQFICNFFPTKCGSLWSSLRATLDVGTQQLLISMVFTWDGATTFEPWFFVYITLHLIIHAT